MKRKICLLISILTISFLSLYFCETALAGSFYIGGGGTDSKPQSKLWFNDGTWWGIVLDGRDQYFYKLEGMSMVKQTFADALVDPVNSSRADVLWNGEHLYVLMFHYSKQSKLYKYTYDDTSKSYSLVPQFPVNILMDSGRETAVIAEDSTGKLWITYEAGNTIRVIWSTSSDHILWDFSGIDLHVGVHGDDISSITSFDNKIGVIWSNQDEDNYGFSIHNDGDPETSWGPLEIFGSGIEDDHINLAQTSSNEILAITKTAAIDDINLFIRADIGWEGPYLVAHDATRPIVVYDDESMNIYVMYTDLSSNLKAIMYKTASLFDLIWSDPQVLIDVEGTHINNVTSTKQSVDSLSGLLVMASGNDSYAYYEMIDISPVTSRPVATVNAAPGSGFAPLTVQFTGSGFDEDGYIVSYEWDFGDGTSSAEQNPVHTFTVPNTYVTQLVVTDDQGATGEATVEVIVGFDPAGAVTAPELTDQNPAPGETNVSTGIIISARIRDFETGVDIDSIVMTVDGNVVIPVITGSPSDYLLEYTPPGGLANMQTVSVRIYAQDFAITPNVLDETYSFVTGSGAVTTAMINFQPESSEVPPGYQVDSGNVFDANRGYGWSKQVRTQDRDVNPDQRLDTYVYVYNTDSADWNYTVPNGTYNVTIVAGSPEYTGIHNVSVEGNLVINADATHYGEFIEVRDYPVTVNDGQLTVTIGGTGGKKKTKLSYILIQE